MSFDRNGMKILSPSECLQLLASCSVGRVAFSRDALPTIVPVNYCLLDHDIVFAIETNRNMLRVMHDNVVAFEVDSIDSTTHLGWSIEVVGIARQITEGDSTWCRAGQLHLHPWVGHRPNHLIGLATDHVTGRSVIGDPVPVPTR
jgi:hypothetical protein